MGSFYMKDHALSGKTALVSGGSSGIGLASAIALAKDGAAVIIMGRGAEALSKARKEILAAAPGSRVEIYAGDALAEAAVKGALTAAYGISDRLDIVVSVVGNPTFKPLLMRELQDVRDEIDLNFSTAFLMVRHGAPMLTHGGSIICVSSAAATQPSWGLAIYAAAKAALERFVRAAAFELGGAGIRVNAVRPGATVGPERATDPSVIQMAPAFVAETPMGRLGEPVDVARVVRFLAGPESGWVTGQTVGVDGGMDQGKGPDFMDAFFGKEAMDQIREGKPITPAQ
jgi:NAD(P)-dependent dehydrogenase (short-subunit alcohol dehydrogenase family)